MTSHSIRPLDTLLECLPHGKSIRWIDHIESADDQSLAATLTVRDGFFSSDAPARDQCSSILIEYAGQAISLHSAYLRQRSPFNDGAPMAPGVIISLRECQLSANRIQIGVPLTVHVSTDCGSEDAAKEYLVRVVSFEGRSLFEGRCTVFTEGAA